MLFVFLKYTLIHIPKIINNKKGVYPLQQSKALMKHSSILKVSCKLLLLLKGFKKMVFLIFFPSAKTWNDSDSCYVLAAFFGLVLFLCASKDVDTFSVLFWPLCFVILYVGLVNSSNPRLGFHYFKGSELMWYMGQSGIWYMCVLGSMFSHWTPHAQRIRPL